jgi:GMP synthase (glutamine-hydrolysing)
MSAQVVAMHHRGVLRTVYVYITLMESREDYGECGPASRIKARIEAASGEPCLIVHYRDVDMALMAELDPQAIVVSGFSTKLQDCKIEWFYGLDEVMKECMRPMLAICGSHQLIGHLWGRDIRRLKGLQDTPMRRLRKDEHWPREPQGNGQYDLSAQFIARGTFPIRRLKTDPLFAGLPKTMLMRCSHYCEVKKLPSGFELLAESDHCTIEAMRLISDKRILYGTQFHP